MVELADANMKAERNDDSEAKGHSNSRKRVKQLQIGDNQRGYEWIREFSFNRFLFFREIMIILSNAIQI